jgi:hypothetical protein
MKRRILVPIVLCFISINLKAQTPDWADEAARKLNYPDTLFLVGFASERNVNNEEPQTLLNRIESYAKGQLIEYIQVKVQSEAVQEVKENNDNIQKSYRSIYSASSNLDLVGLKVEKSYDSKTKMGYALAYARKADLYSYYKGLVESGLTKAIQKIEQANNALKNGDIQHSLKACLEAGNILPEVEQAQKVLLAINAGRSTDNDIQNERTARQRTTIENLVRQAQRSSGNTVDEASLFIARGLKLQTGNLEIPLLLSNFTYQDTKMGSEFSRRLSQSLQSKLVGEAGYKIETEATADKKYILTGTFWKETNEVKLIATLKDLNGKIVATAEAFIPSSWFETTKVNYLPENFEQAYSKMRAFSMNEVLKGDLNVEIWTNKGDENLLYTEGEKLKFFVRANKECYLRFIYHLADGQSALLLDNYYIAENMTNKVVEIPFEFECSEPFGVETLQANAQTVEFPKLTTTRNDGYDFINDNLNEVLLNTRGFKKVVSKDVQKAEKRLTFTTMK